MKKTKKSYTAIWRRSDDLTQRANVSFDAFDDADAIKKADKIAVEVDSTRSPRTIICQGRTVQTLNTGVSA